MNSANVTLIDMEQPRAFDVQRVEQGFLAMPRASSDTRWSEDWFFQSEDERPEHLARMVLRAFAVRTAIVIVRTVSPPELWVVQEGPRA